MRFRCNGCTDIGLRAILCGSHSKEQGAIITQFRGLSILNRALLPGWDAFKAKEFIARFAKPEDSAAKPWFEYFTCDYKLLCEVDIPGIAVPDAANRRIIQVDL